MLLSRQHKHRAARNIVKARAPASSTKSAGHTLFRSLGCTHRVCRIAPRRSAVSSPPDVLSPRHPFGSSGPCTFCLSCTIAPRRRMPTPRPPGETQHAHAVDSARRSESNQDGQARSWNVRGRGADGVCSRSAAKIAPVGWSEFVRHAAMHSYIYPCMRTRRATSTLLPPSSSCVLVLRAHLSFDVLHLRRHRVYVNTLHAEVLGTRPSRLQVRRTLPLKVIHVICAVERPPSARTRAGNIRYVLVHLSRACFSC